MERARIAPEGAVPAAPQLLGGLEDVETVDAEPGDVLEFTGDAWVPRGVPVIDRGTVSVNGTSLAAGAGLGPTAVSFVEAFIDPPVVVCSNQSAPGGSQNIVPRAINVTTAGFQIWLYNAGSADATWTGLSVAWVAVAAP